jgi:CDP-glycerol glycerophosphotransferase (TagB/SpsB family)
MLIDTGSDASIDMTYTQGADFYLGDVSSQIAEFMIRPRPCLFINSNRAAWQNNPDYLFWEIGPVIDNVDTLGASLANAVASHGQWVARQREYFRATFDAEPDAIGHSAAEGAGVIAAFLERG